MAAVEGRVAQLRGASPDCGMHAKKPALASKPELKRAAGARNVFVNADANTREVDRALTP